MKRSKVKYIGTYLNGFAFKPNHWNQNEEGLPILRIQNLTNSDKNSNYCNADDIPKKYIVKNGDILISWAATLDAFRWSGGNAYLNQHIFLAFPSKDVDRDFFFWLMKKTMADFEGANKHGIMMQHLTLQEFGNAEVMLPSMSQQQKIAQYLNRQIKKIDVTIEKSNLQLSALSSYRQSLITRAVTKGLDPNVEMKDSGVEWIGSIPREWKTSKISFVSDVTLGKMLCPRQTDSEQTLETYLCAGSISWDGVKDYIKEMWFSSKEKSELLLIAGDVLIVEGGAGFGMTTLYKGEHSPCYFQNSIIRVRGHHNVMTSDFINYWMRFTYTAYLKTVCNEATFSHYTKEKVSETPILVPPLNEQKKIADFCKLVDERVKTICAGIENQISKLNEYRSSLISAAVTGQLAIDEEASA